MTIPFYKIHIAGNGFILIDLTALEAANKGKPALESTSWPLLSRLICDKRYGVGGSGAMFLAADNTIRIFTPKGKSSPADEDALLCAARFAFDSGRVVGGKIRFNGITGPRDLSVLGAHQFAIDLGSPFSLLDGRVLLPQSEHLVESIEFSGTSLSCSAIHIRENVVTAFPRALGTLDFAGFSALVREVFPGKSPVSCVAQAITEDTIMARCSGGGEASICAAAAASLATAHCAGQCGTEAVVMFETRGNSGDPDRELELDRDNSRRVAVSWDTTENEIRAIGSGGYLFEGSFYAPDSVS